MQRTRFRGTYRTLGVVLMLPLLAACPKKKGDGGDAATDAPVAVADDAAVPAAVAEPSNAGDIGRFPDETPIDHTPAALQWPQSKIRKTPPSGEVVATLAKGATVVQIASHDKYDLVVFDDPAKPGNHLMGWVVKDAFVAGVAPKPTFKTCPAGQTSLVGDQSFCAKICTADPECGPGLACNGKAQIVKPNGTAGDAVRHCTAIASIADAGAVAVADSGAAGDAGAIAKPDAAAPVVVDAGVPPPIKADAAAPAPPKFSIIIVPPINGACAADFVLLPETKLCHRKCPPVDNCGKQRCSKCVGTQSCCK